MLKPSKQVYLESTRIKITKRSIMVSSINLIVEISSLRNLICATDDKTIRHKVKRT